MSQEIGAYRTIASGNFGNIGIWQVYNGTLWTPASAKPSHVNDIYIDQGHLLTLTGNEEVKSVFINAETGANQKLNLNASNLNIYGTLQAFSGAAPGSATGSWNSQNWIGNSIISTLTFKGNSRIIIPKNAWSGFTTQSRYTVIFDPGAGKTLTIEEPFKAVRFIVRSGIVLQKLDTSVIPNFCSSLSFNTETTFYPAGPFGDFIIENGGIFISECNEKIIARSVTGSVSANLFNIQTGGELVLEGTTPRIEAANFQLEGKVTFRGGSSTKTLLTSSFADAGTINSFHHLEIQGTQNVSFPASISVTGDISKVGTGTFLTSTSHITFTGNQVQTVSGFSLTPRDLTVNKSGGKVNLAQNLTVLRNLTMLNGKLDFQNNQLTINSSNSGTYNYTGGSWENLSRFIYNNSPTNLTAINATFPFGDRYHGGIRKVQMLGTSAGGNLSINYTEYKGADFNPGFEDTGGIPILYRLFSYFQFSGLSTSLNPLELRISANNLIVDQPEDIRLVCTGYAAPGNHILSMDAINLWAIRDLTFDDLPGKNFTVGSFRTLSILPVTWLSVSAKKQGANNQITWTVAQEKDNEKFEVYHSTDPLVKWTKLGEVLGKGDTDTPVSYSFIDQSSSNLFISYYQIKQFDYSGKWAWSPVFRLERDLSNSNDQLSISPNPHTYGKISVVLTQKLHSEKTLVKVHTTQGLLISSFNFYEAQFSEKLELLKPGLYLITFSNEKYSHHIRWIKH
ncbi:T9SS type A sorting domain-containing protein [Algoriphagus ratkowskyi]|uniref:T9SS type A sorting domain-containing protein n=1 Tax=Algoriphagus ratkowskyi TaxID=57028 RepID=UPI001302A816|nr:T9SS type A sorting domain-containing protein [Algoriphagus ratkowskyi]